MSRETRHAIGGIPNTGEGELKSNPPVRRASDEPVTPPSPDGRVLLASTAQSAEANVRAVTTDIDDAILAAVPALGGDVDVRRQLGECTRANVDVLLDLLADPSLVADQSVPDEAVRFVRTLVRRDADPHDLVQAYRVGQNAFWRWWMTRLTSATEPGPALVDALETSSGVVFSHVDFVVDALMREWERKTAADGTLVRRTDVVRELLSDAPPPLAEASQRLDYDLDRVMTAAVLCVDQSAGEIGAGRLEAAAGALSAAAGADRAVTLAAGPATLWAWIGTSEPPDAAALVDTAGRLADEGVRVALGTPVRRGFRQSHEEALAAGRIANLAGNAFAAISYADVEVVSLLIGDQDRLVPFVKRAVGGLGARGEGAERLRTTVAAWLAEGRNASRAAARLGLHKNTILYRLQRAEQMRGRPLTEDRIGLELALAVVDTLGVTRFDDAPENVRADA
jgi:DNA-binding PucR family transcriptional regulator